MATYKISNKADVIIRAYSACNIGNVVVANSNQPYTMLHNIDIEIEFDDNNSKIKSKYGVMYHEDTRINFVSFNDVPLTERVMNMIFAPSDAKLFSGAESCVSENKKIYLTPPVDAISQVYIFDTNRDLVAVYPILTNFTINVPKDGTYNVIYQYEANTSFSLKSSSNNYFTIDIITINNIDDETTKMNIHLNKCGVSVNRNMSFSDIKTINFNAHILDENNYIAFM